MQDKTYELELLRRGLALLRITLGIIILATWFDNLNKGLYTAAGLRDFFDWLFSPAGNASTLTFYHSLIEATILPVAGIFAVFQLVAELFMGVALVTGGLTRLASAGAMLFFFNLFLSYFGGQEWIWTYVLLFMSAMALAFGYAGRLWGIDAWLVKQRGEPPLPILW